MASPTATNSPASVRRFSGERFPTGVHGPWTESRERLYRDLLRTLSGAPPNIAILPEAERFPWVRDARNYERLQFGRLCHFVRQREPDAFIGGSLLVFRLTDAEMQRALYGDWR